MSVLSEPWMVLQDFHWHWFMFLAASDLRDYLGNNRSKENNGSIWWNYIFPPFFFSLTYCLCFLTNTAECLSPVHTGEGIITKPLNNLVLELSWRDINSGIIECTFHYALSVRVGIDWRHLYSSKYVQLMSLQLWHQFIWDVDDHKRQISLSGG